MNAKSRRGLTIIPLWAVFVLSIHLNAQVESLVFKRINVEDGLSQSTANCLLQDRNGFIWIGTEDGLNKYDGYNFTVYRPIPGDRSSISNNSIWAILQDRRGNIWVGTYNGLNRFDINTERFTRFMPDPANPRSLSHKYARTLIEDRSGTIWIGTQGGGLCCFEPQTQDFTVYRHDPNDPSSLANDQVLSLLEEKGGRLLVGTASGLDQLDLQTKAISHLQNLGASASPPVGRSIRAIFHDWEGFLWLGTDKGLCRVDTTGGRITWFRSTLADPSSISHDSVLTIFEDHKRTLWIGTEGGLNTYDRRLNRFHRFLFDPDDPLSLSGNEVRSFLEDRMNSLWVGLFASGICKYESEGAKFRSFRHLPNSPNTLSISSTQSFYEDPNGILWIGTNGGGLNRYDRRSNRFSVFRSDPRSASSLSDDRVRVIFKDHAGTMWIGTYGGGVCRFDPDRGTFHCFRNIPGDPSSLSGDRIRSIVEDRDRRLWIGTDGAGLNLFDPRSSHCRRFQFDRANPGSLSNDRVMKLLLDRSGQLWIATFGGGLNRYLRESGSFKRYQNDPENIDSLSLDYVVTLTEDRNGMIWIGTDGAGMDRFDPARGTFTHYTDAHGLPNKTIYAILEDKAGNLWVSHNQGISRFDPKAESFKNYTMQDGLQGSEYTGNSAHQNPRTGEMFFGGTNGFNAFLPEAIQDNPHVPPVLITRFQLLNRPVAIGERVGGRLLLPRSLQESSEIVLSYLDKTFSFEYTALNFISPEKNQYAYMMEGFDSQWNYVADRRFASYTALPAGRYVFRVKGSNNDGVWNEKGASIRIRITPPFWKTWWFIGSSLLLIGLIAYLWYTRRIRQLEKSKAELERLVALRTQELKDISLKDPLTGLRNRRYIQEVLKDDVSAFLKKKLFLLKSSNRRIQGREDVYGILMVDIDHFKTINDRYGHDMGDRWLVQFAAVLKRHIRADDQVIRFGGEEFLIILKNTAPDYVDTFAQKIKNEVAKIDLALENEDLRRSCSIGFTRFPFYEGQPLLVSLEKTIMLADLGLYYAKRNGRNLAVKVEPLAKVPDEQQLASLTTSIEYGIENGFFRIHPYA